MKKLILAIAFFCLISTTGVSLLYFGALRCDSTTVGTLTIVSVSERYDPFLPFLNWLGEQETLFTGKFRLFKKEFERTPEGIRHAEEMKILEQELEDLRNYKPFDFIPNAPVKERPPVSA